MNTGPTPLFRDLAPPPGGEQRLRQSIADLRDPAGGAIRRHWVGAAASAVAVAVVWITVIGSPGPRLGDQAHDAVRTVLGPPAGRFEEHEAQVIERPEQSGPVRLYVLVPDRDNPGS